MRSFYWWPSRRRTYRIIKIRHWLHDYALQQRYRWLWYEWWRDVDHADLDDLRDRKQFLESLDEMPESERVVSRT